MKTSNNIQTNATIKSSHWPFWKLDIPCFLNKKPLKNYIISPYYWRHAFFPNKALVKLVGNHCFSEIIHTLLKVQCSKTGLAELMLGKLILLMKETNVATRLVSNCRTLLAQHYCFRPRAPCFYSTRLKLTICWVNNVGQFDRCTIKISMGGGRRGGGRGEGKQWKMLELGWWGMGDFERKM